MPIFINNSNIGFNGALPGRTIETDDQNYIDALIARGFEQIEAESPVEQPTENKKPETKKIQTETEPQNPPVETAENKKPETKKIQTETAEK